MKENTFIKAELVKLVVKLKVLPSKVYFCKNGKKVKLVRNLVDAGKFLGYKTPTMHTYNHYNKNNLGKGKLFYEISNTSKLMFDIAKEIEKGGNQ